MLSETNHHTTLVNVFEAFNHHDADAVAAYMTENSIFETKFQVISTGSGYEPKVLSMTLK